MDTWSPETIIGDRDICKFSIKLKKTLTLTFICFNIYIELCLCMHVRECERRGKTKQIEKHSCFRRTSECIRFIYIQQSVIKTISKQFGSIDFTWKLHGEINDKTNKTRKEKVTSRQMAQFATKVNSTKQYCLLQTISSVLCLHRKT